MTGSTPGGNRSEQPHPRRSITIVRANDPRRRRNRTYDGFCQIQSTLATIGGR